MEIVSNLRKIYRKLIDWPWLDRIIYKILDWLTNTYAILDGYSFPPNYIRRWKLNMLWGLYEKETVVLFKKIIKPGMVAVDIGAHIGYFTRCFSHLVGKNGMVYALEADPENFQLLKKNTASFRNVKLFELAVADRQGTIDFYRCNAKSGCHSILPNVPLNFQKSRITVKVGELDTVLEREGVKRVDVIKMDIEGGESAALRGMKDTLENRGVTAIVIEFAPAWIKASGVQPLNFLQNIASFGFKIFAIKPSGLIRVDVDSEDSYLLLLPKTETAYNEFINLYCVRA